MNYKQIILLNILKNSSVKCSIQGFIIHMHTPNTKYNISLNNADMIELYGINYSKDEIAIIHQIVWDYTNNEYILQDLFADRYIIHPTTIACQNEIYNNQYNLWLLRQIVLSQ